MNVLALDLGTYCGYAFNRGEFFQAGTWKLASAKEVTAWGKARLSRRNDPRVKRLCEQITELGEFDVLVFEDVQFVSTTYQAHLWAGLRSAAWLCGVAKHFEAVPVKTLKLFATGNGNATKELMAKILYRVSELPRRFELVSTLDDNGVDACWLWIWAQKNLTRIENSTTIK